MLVLIVGCIICFMVVVWWLIGYFQFKLREKELFNSLENLEESTIVLFSNRELSNRIMKIINKTNKDLEIRCRNNYVLRISKDISKKELINKLDLFQQYMIEKTNDKAITDDIDLKMFVIWINYGHNVRYRKSFERIIIRQLEAKEITAREFHEMYNRFYFFTKKERC